MKHEDDRRYLEPVTEVPWGPLGPVVPIHVRSWVPPRFDVEPENYDEPGKAMRMSVSGIDALINLQSADSFISKRLAVALELPHRGHWDRVALGGELSVASIHTVIVTFAGRHVPLMVGATDKLHPNVKCILGSDVFARNGIELRFDPGQKTTTFVFQEG